ncbi:MAG: thymidine kinase [Planctomycetaceae bacterium]|nr:thymidine kinase [Planctomycetaceae bacterium]
MAKLYFYYSAMNAGKSSTLIQSSHNYRERGMNTLVLKPQIDTLAGENQVASRIGLEAAAVSFSHIENLLELTRRLHEESRRHCLLIDEAQFLTKKQVQQLGEVADQLDIPVLAYGLRTDFQGNLFEGSQYLLAWADALVEIKTICHCGRKATMVLRLDGKGNVIRDGEQIKIGGNDVYLSVCRKHFREGLPTRKQPELPFSD